MERDDALNLLKKEKFDTLIRKIEDKNLFEYLSKDFIFKSIFDENILKEINNSSRDEDFKALSINMLNNLHINKEHPFKFVESEISIVGDILISKFPSPKLAKQFPNHPKSKEIIENKNKEIKDKISESIIKNEFHLNQVSGQNFQNDKYLKSIFNSPQEEFLFEALMRNINNEYLVIPNISLPTIISKDVLQEAGFKKGEMDFFYKTSIDISIVDKLSYEVLLVIELDSSIHDSPKQIKKDEIKNKILKISNIKMFRIRQKDWLKYPDYNNLATSIIEKIKK